MSNMILYLIIGGTVSSFGILFIFIGHDLFILNEDNTKTLNELLSQYNNTGKCSDVKYIIDGQKDYWLKGGVMYDGFVKIYKINNCDEVLKK